MNFAKNLLGKYGWKEGDGLGKEKQGIKKPIKANLKFDQSGLGTDPSKEFNNNWWERAFNDAAKNVKVKKQKNGDISVDLKDPENSVEVTTKGYSMKKLRENGSKYGQYFRKFAENAEVCSFATTETKILTDEELFRACGGRTAHKGARHGLKLSGKLARLEQQEKELLAKMQARNVEQKREKRCDQIKKSENQLSIVDDDCTENILKKKKKKRKSELKDEQISDIETSENSSKPSKKRSITIEDPASKETQNEASVVKSKKKKKNRYTKDD